MTDDIAQQVIEHIKGLKPSSATVDGSTDLIASGVLDSIAILEFIAFLSERFSIKIPPREVTPANLGTPAAAAALFKACMR